MSTYKLSENIGFHAFPLYSTFVHMLQVEDTGTDQRLGRLRVCTPRNFVAGEERSELKL